MSRMKLLNDLPVGSAQVEGFCLVKNAAIRQNSKGVDYMDFVLADSEGEGVAKLWDYNHAVHGDFQTGDIIKIRGSIILWKDAEQIKIEKIRHMNDKDNVDMNGLIPCAPFDPEWLFDELYQTAENFTDYDLKRLVQYIMKERKEQLLVYPAAVKLHHATRGGLLHHSWTILQLAKSVAQAYPMLNQDLLFAGAILHDIGKLEELDTSSLGLASAYTESGQLLGHITIGINIVAETAELLGIPARTAMLVEHMILSHHGTAEYGSPKAPMFPEAEVLSELDLLDSRLFEMYSALESVQPHGFSERQWALENRQLYRHNFGSKESDS